MGERINIKCNSCSVDKDIYIGCGRMATDINVIYEMLDETEQESFNNLYTNNKLRQYNWEYVAGYCKNCNDIEVSGKVTCITQEGDKIIYGCVCKKCGQAVIEKNIKEQHKCLICEQGNIISELLGFWD